MRGSRYSLYYTIKSIPGKGSKEAIELGKKMREARESKSGQENTFGKTMGVYLQGYCILYL